MHVDAKFTVQFMQKDRVSDKPLMGEVITCPLSKEIDIPAELQPYVDHYINGDRDYTVDKIALDIWKKKVRKIYPDMFAKFTMSDGSVTQLKPTPLDIIDAAFCICIEDTLNDYLSQNVDEILKENNIVPPSDTDQYYYADKFVHLLPITEK